MKRILAIFAHPDDESAIAGTLAQHAREGDQVSLICMTKGEAGEISDASLASPDNLGSVREAELRCACDVIGVADLHLLGYCDSGMDGTPENDVSTAFIRADPDEVRFKLIRLIRSIKPHVVITFEPEGWYGHPDHIYAGRYATETYYLAADPAFLPEAGPAWKPRRLYHAAFLRSSFKVLADYARENGIESGMIEQTDWNEPDPLADRITHTIDVSPYADIKEASLRCHKTQFGDDHLFTRIPVDLWQEVNGLEHFIQVDPAVEPSASKNGSLVESVLD